METVSMNIVKVIQQRILPVRNNQKNKTTQSNNFD